MPTGLTHLEEIKLVLRDAEHPMRAQEIVDELHKRHHPISGKTPSFTINARISEDIKKNGARSDFKRLGRGLYALRDFPKDEYITISHKKKISPDNLILVFPSIKLGEIGYFHGIRKDYKKYVKELLNTNTSYFMSRIEAEEQNETKQVVSYVIVRYGDRVLRYTRGQISSVRDYLEDYYSIGFGGHVQHSDWTLFEPGSWGYFNSVRRELREEIGLHISPDALPPFVGVLNDDSSPLGRHHFAFVHMLDLDTPTFIKGEKSVNELDLIEIKDLGNEFANYEYWSKLCIQVFFGDKIALDCFILPRKELLLRERSDFILIVGNVGSGKSEVCTLLEREFGYRVIRVSKVLQSLIGIESSGILDRRLLQDAGYNFVNESGGQEKLASALYKSIKSLGEGKFVIDGLRYPETLDNLKSYLNKPVTVIFIDNTIDNLYRYYQDRESKRTSFTKFLEVINHPVERQIEQFRSYADIIVYNHGSLESYLKSMENYFKDELS